MTRDHAADVAGSRSEVQALRIRADALGPARRAFAARQGAGLRGAVNRMPDGVTHE
jgi:hypothetical protein